MLLAAPAELHRLGPAMLNENGLPQWAREIEDLRGPRGDLRRGLLAPARRSRDHCPVDRRARRPMRPQPVTEPARAEVWFGAGMPVPTDMQPNTVQLYVR
ncbi:hypothetical protein [Nannocystis pusilla]|uniref:hypothetical protein n=1 Tax=Nannocystis pusilla TaxID=889268 RepID=UPI003B7A41F9